MVPPTARLAYAKFMTPKLKQDYLKDGQNVDTEEQKDEKQQAEKQQDDKEPSTEAPPANTLEVVQLHRSDDDKEDKSGSVEGISF